MADALHHSTFNTLSPRQNGRHFPNDIFKWISLNENGWISINISLKFVPRGPINNIPTLVQVMAWHRPGDKPLSEPMMVRLLTHICVTRPQWVKIINCTSHISWHEPNDHIWLSVTAIYYIILNIYIYIIWYYVIFQWIMVNKLT